MAFCVCCWEGGGVSDGCLVQPFRIFCLYDYYACGSRRRHRPGRPWTRTTHRARHIPLDGTGRPSPLCVPFTPDVYINVVLWNPADSGPTSRRRPYRAPRIGNLARPSGPTDPSSESSNDRMRRLTGNISCRCAGANSPEV